MKLRLQRYTPDMLRSLSTQTYASLILNAIFRGFIFSSIIQLIAFASGQKPSSILQFLLLALIFSFVIFAIDLFEKSWSQLRTNKKP